MVITAPAHRVPPALRPASAHRAGPASSPLPGAGRDHAIDAVRALGTVAVVLLHWLMVEATWDGTTLEVGNALAHGHAWLLTWLNPLPVLFFAAGAAAAYDVGRRPGLSGPALAARRARSLVRPVAVLAGSGVLALLLLPMLGVPAGALLTAAAIAVQPLWFLPVLLALVALAPALLRSVQRRGRTGAGTVAALTAAALLLDAGRWASGEVAVGWPTLVIGWAVPFTLGLVHAHRRATGRPLGARTGAALLGGGLAATLTLIALGPYPVSLIGMPGEAVSNLGPPTAPVVTFAIAQVGLVVLAAGPLSRWGARSRLVAWVGQRSMPLYLWHLPAALAVTGLVLLGLDQTLPTSWDATWWATRPTFLAACALVLGGCVTAVAAPGRLRLLRRTAPRRAGGPLPGLTAPGTPAARG